MFTVGYDDELGEVIEAFDKELRLHGLQLVKLSLPSEPYREYEIRKIETT